MCILPINIRMRIRMRTQNIRIRIRMQTLNIRIRIRMCSYNEAFAFAFAFEQIYAFAFAFECDRAFDYNPDIVITKRRKKLQLNYRVALSFLRKTPCTEYIIIVYNSIFVLYFLHTWFT